MEERREEKEIPSLDCNGGDDDGVGVGSENGSVWCAAFVELCDTPAPPAALVRESELDRDVISLVVSGSADGIADSGKGGGRGARLGLICGLFVELPTMPVRVTVPLIRWKA